MATIVFSVLTLLTLAAAFVDAGSPCPVSREMIYPCHCTNVPLTKKDTFTIVTCRHVPRSESLSKIYLSLRLLHIDRFVIYDSFWEVGQFGGDADSHRKLPQNWMTQLHIKELEIVDSQLSPKFACDITTACSNNFLRHVTIHNSSMTGDIFSICESSGKYFAWTSCLNKLQTFRFVDNSLKMLKATIFPDQMSDLLFLNLSNNEIGSLSSKVFANLPKLHTLDLSHNKLSSIPADIFGSKETEISHLDLSWNKLKVLSSGFFKLTPFLVNFFASENQIDKLQEKDWKDLPMISKIKMVDLSDNAIVCDCHMMWLNCSLHVNTVVLGFCSNEEFSTTPLRRASVFMMERCENNQLLEKKKNRNTCNSLKKDQSNFLSPDRNPEVGRLSLGDSRRSQNIRTRS